MNKLIKTIKEIRAVGFRDWWWFVHVLKRNEFSGKLSLGYRWGEGTLDTLPADRKRAHNIDLKLEGKNLENLNVTEEEAEEFAKSDLYKKIKKDIINLDNSERVDLDE
jgi:hypothetical protein